MQQELIKAISSSAVVPAHIASTCDVPTQTARLPVLPQITSVLPQNFCMAQWLKEQTLGCFSFADGLLLSWSCVEALLLCSFRIFGHSFSKHKLRPALWGEQNYYSFLSSKHLVGA